MTGQLPPGGIPELTRVRLNAILAELLVSQDAGFIFPEAFRAVGDGTTDDTAALQAAHDYCYNGGNIRGQVILPPNKTYLVSDANADGYCLIWKDGVFLSGCGHSSVIATTQANVCIIHRIRTGTARKGVIRDLLLDGRSVAKSCIEIYGSSYDGVENIECRSAKVPVVLDGCQNIKLKNVVARSATEWNYKILNGAGSAELDNCYAIGGGVGHILVDNDPNYPGYALGHPVTALAYDKPTLVLISGGVYETETVAGTLKCCLRINKAAYVVADHGANFSGVATMETVIDDGRWTLAATFLSTSSFSISAADMTAYLPVGRRVLIQGTTSGTIVYGVVTSVTFGTSSTVALTMDAGQSVPNEALNVEFGRSDDGATATWDPGVTSTRLRDVYLYGAGLTGPAIRGGSADAMYDGVALTSCNGDWFELSNTASIIRPKGSLGSGKMRAKHIKGADSGSATISYTPLNQANSGVFEHPGQASSLAYSSAGRAWRYEDPIAGVSRIMPIATSGSGAPAFSANHINQFYTDVTNQKAYWAYRTGNGSGDWLLLN